MACITCSDDHGLATLGSNPRNVRSPWLAPLITYRVLPDALGTQRIVQYSRSGWARRS